MNTAPPLPAKLSGYPSVPKYSTQEQEERSGMEVQRNTENVLNVDSTYKRYLYMCGFVFILSFEKGEHGALK